MSDIIGMFAGLVATAAGVCLGIGAVKLVLVLVRRSLPERWSDGSLMERYE